MSHVERFNEKAKAWDAHPVINELARVFAETLVARVALAPDMKALDFGCGTGLVAMRIRCTVAHLLAIDTSPGMIEILREKMAQEAIANVEARCGDIFGLDLPRGELDLVYTLMVLHHVPDLVRLLARFGELVKPGGWLCIADLEPEDGSFHTDIKDVHRGFDPVALIAEIESAGFAPPKFHTMHVVKKPNAAGTLQAYPVFFLQAQRL